MSKMKFPILFSFMILGIAFSTPQVMADPSANLRVITVDPLAAGFDGSITFSTSPFNDDVFAISNDGDLPLAGEDAVAFGGNVYVSDFTRIIRLNLDSSGAPVGGIGNNVDEITGEVFSPDIVSLTVDDNGILYVADANNEIYTIDPSGTLPAAKSTISIDQVFVEIRDITINGDFLYILDAGADGGNGAIYKVNLSDYAVDTAYSGSTGSELLTDTTAIAVKGDDMFVSGPSFSFGAGILKITSSGAVEFSDNSSSVLSDPLDLAIDEVGNDLYVTDGSFIYRLSLANTPSQPIPEINNTLISDPVGITTLSITGQVADVHLSLTKTVNATSALPGQGLLYTVTATNDGPDPATNVFIHDFFPLNGVESVKNSGQLSFTAEVHDVSTGAVSEIGDCDRRGTDTFVVDCDNFGTLDAGDFVVVTLEGKIIPGAPDTLVNRAVAENFGENVEATATTTLNLPIQLSVSKTSTPNSVVAGNGESVDYVIKVKNENLVDATGVVITDTLPNGISSLDVNLEPAPPSCQITDGVNESTILQCGPYNLVNTVGSVEIHYSVIVDADAIDPLENSVEVTCANCATMQPISTSTEINRESDLSIEKISEQTEVTAGQDSILYTLSVTNNGPSDAAHVVITDNLPNGVTFSTSGTSSECSNPQNNDVICNITSLPAGETQTLAINMTVNSNAVDTIDNTASVSSDSEETNPSDNQASADSIGVIQQADVTVTKSGPEETVAGKKITYAFEVTNTGPSVAENVIVTDELPTAFTFIPSTTSGSLTDPACQFNLGLVTCDFGNIGPSITQTKSIQVQIGLDVTGSIQNKAEVFTDTEESNSDNNISTVFTQVNPPFCGRPESDFAHVITGTAGNDVLMGTNDDDLIIGLGGNDKIHGKKGNDCIIGGDGDDKIWGGPGDDTIEGNTGNNEIHGQQGNDVLSGGDGNDKIWGGQGMDTIDAGNGDNQVHGNQEDDSIVAGNGNDKIWGGQGDDTINAGDGNNRVNGNQGKDTITAGSGNDWINGGQADDTINAGDGNNRINGDQGNDIITTGSGNDWISGGQGDDVIHAGAGNDKLFGKQGTDNLFGEAGDDVLNGAQGNDLLNGGANNDQCDGGQGHNTFVDCESQKPMTDENDDEEDAEDQEADEENDNNGNHDNHGNNHDNDNNGHGNDNGHDNKGNDKDKGKKK